METVVVYDSAKQWHTPLQKQIVAGINDTRYFTGFFGLGITTGNFQDTVVLSPLASLVEQVGVVPSHSYGYTAGAYYGEFGWYAIVVGPVTNEVEQKEARARPFPSRWEATTRIGSSRTRQISISISTVKSKF